MTKRAWIHRQLADLRGWVEVGFGLRIDRNLLNHSGESAPGQSHAFLANVFALGCPRKVDDWLDGDYAACIFACILGSSFLSSSALSVRVTAAEGCAQTIIGFRSVLRRGPAVSRAA